MKTNRVFRNASWIIGCRIAQSGLALLINALTARYFGPTNFGLINYAASLVAFVTPLVTMGTTDVLVNEIIQNPEKEGTVLGTSITMTFVSSWLCIAGLGTFVWMANPEDTTTFFVVVLYSLLLTAQSLEQLQYWFHAKYLSKVVSIASFLAYIIVSLYKILLLNQKKSIYWFAVSHSLDYLLIAAGLFVVYRLKHGQKLRFSAAVAKTLWNKGRHYILPGLMGLVLAQSDRVMLRFLCGDAEVGLYSAALSVSALTGFVFNAIITSFRPAVLESKQMSAARYEANMIKLYGLVTYLALTQSIVLTIFAKPVISILYGQAYYQAIPMLRLAVWYTIFSYIGGVRAVWILSESKQAYLWSISLSGMILNIVLNLILIPRFQGVGASIATTITQLFTNIIMVYMLKPLRINVTYMIKGMNMKNLAGHRETSV